LNKGGKVERFIQRTWRQTSEKICLANDIPPGFRIVLLDEGRVKRKRSDLLVRSGSFGGYPGSCSIGSFLDEALKNHVKNTDCLDYTSVQLRDHRDNPIEPELALRRVRNMPGAGGKYTRASKESSLLVDEIEGEIDDALSVFDGDETVADASEQRDFIFLKALIQHIISRFRISDLKDVLDFYQEEIKRRSLQES
jgi:hypothetical protein